MKPQKQINGLTFFPVPEFGAAEQAFGADMRHYFDRYDLPKVPPEFEDTAQSLFFDGGHLPPLSGKVDRVKAGAAVRAWLGSWAPAHEAKIATVAYALWLWSDDESLADDKDSQEQARDMRRAV